MIDSRILVIDDDEGVRDVIVDILVHAGYAVDSAVDGAQGLERYKARRPDLVITDIIMPDREGIGTIIELKRLDPTARIIAISGGGRISKDEHLSTAEGLGIHGSLAKPFDHDVLLAAVSTALAAGPAGRAR